MKRTAAERSEEWRAEVVPAEVDLSRSSVERACYALRLLRAAVGGAEAPGAGRAGLRPPAAAGGAVGGVSGGGSQQGGERE